MKKIIIMAITLLFSPLLSACNSGNISTNLSTNLIDPDANLKVNKTNNECLTNKDCRFSAIDGVCYTVEYAKRKESAGNNKITVPPQPDTVCECLENKCALKD